MLLDHLAAQLQARDANHLRRRLRVRDGTTGGQMCFAGQARLAFCSNDYLGLSQHPRTIEALAEGAQRYGAGSGASPLISGHTAADAALQTVLAEWLAPHIPGAQTLYFGSGFAANMALLTTLGDAQATIFSDKLNHASIIDGAQLAQAVVARYPHANIAWLARKLAACTTPIKLIVTDAVFSMDGSLAPLPALLALAEAHDAWLIVDDAHGFGMLGPQGRGALSHFGLCSQRLIYMATRGKAAGVAGAFVAAHPLVIDWLVNTARHYIYSTAAPPALAHALLTSLHIIESDEGAARRAQLQLLVQLLQAGLPAAVAPYGWQLAASATAIQPLLVGSNATALALAAALDAQGIWVPAIRPPTVPVGTARLRITLSAEHTAADVHQLIDAVAKAARGMQAPISTSSPKPAPPAPPATVQPPQHNLPAPARQAHP